MKGIVMKKIAIVVAALALTGCSASTTSTPSSCTDALDAAEELIGGPVVEQSEDTILLTGLIPQAFEAGVNMDSAAVDSIVSTMDEVTARTEARNDEIERIGNDYREAAEDCRGGE